MVKGAQYDGLTIYDSWNFDLPVLPTRSRLHSLQPQGMGTALIECLTSYVSRLAASHCVSPAALLSSTIAPLIGKKYWLRGGARQDTRGSALSKSFNIHTRAVNGIGVIASDWVRTLQTLTLRHDLAQLTMIEWENVFSHRNLLRLTRAWCPACYDSWANSRQPMYEPLLWVFRDVTVCLFHQRRLDTSCPNCNSPLQWLSRSATPGYCEKCDEWLGARADTEGESLTSDELQWQGWVSTNLQEIISARDYLPTPTTQRIKEALTLCIDTVTDGVMNRFSTLIGKPKNTVWGWLQGDSLIPLNDLLRLCYAMNLRLVDFLYTDRFLVFPSDHTANLEFIGHQPRQCRQSPQPFDDFAVEHSLRAALKAHPPKPMTEIAIELRAHKRTLYKHFPALCKEISLRHKNHRINKEQMIRQSKSHTLVKIRKQLLRNGVYPSRRRINNLARSGNGHLRKEKHFLRGEEMAA
jgi:hypothetical protein